MLIDLALVACSAASLWIGYHIGRWSVLDARRVKARLDPVVRLVREEQDAAIRRHVAMRRDAGRDAA